jgi:hypothetical protein
MSTELTSRFGAGLEIGRGLACSTSPFRRLVVTEFYDGAVEGFAGVAASDSIVYFRRVWWDERQDNRLFESYLFPVTALQAEAPELRNFYDRAAILDPSEPFSEADGQLSERLKQLATRRYFSERFYIFCLDIQKEVFILPALED